MGFGVADSRLAGYRRQRVAPCGSAVPTAKTVLGVNSYKYHREGPAVGALVTGWAAPAIRFTARLLVVEAGARLIVYACHHMPPYALNLTPG